MGRIAVRYAKALYGYAVEAEVSELIYSEALVFAEMFPELPGFQSFLENPSISLADKEKVIYGSINGNPSSEFKKLVAFLAHHKRLDQLRWILQNYLSEYRKQNNIHVAVLSTSETIDEETSLKMMDKIKAIYGGTVELRKQVKPELIGGYVLEVEGKQWDGSVKGMLNQLSRQLID